MCGDGPTPETAEPMAGPESLPAHVSPLLTRQEAIRYLRLDQVGVKFVNEAFRKFARATGLKGVQISRAVMYLKEDLDGAILKARDRVAR